MAEATETLLSKKLENGWNNSENIDNFLEEKELAVTITISEYRRLVSESATSEYRIKQVEEDKWARNAENVKLEERVKELENTVFEYRKKFGNLEKESEE